MARIRSISPGLRSARPPSRSGLAFVARRAPPRPLILSSYGSAVVTAVFMALLGWLVIETQVGVDLGLAERVFLSTETCWPFIVAIALWQPMGWPVRPGLSRHRTRRGWRRHYVALG